MTRVRSICMMLAGIAPIAALAQGQPPQSLVVDPQQGATPRPIESAPPEPAPLDQSSEPQIPAPVPLPEVAPLGTPPPIRFERPEVTLRNPPGTLPAPSGNPLAIDPATDPVLALAESTASRDEFAAAVRSAVDRHPFLDEAEAGRDEAEAVRDEARMLELPTVDVSLSYFRVIDREFSNDPQNILERSRPGERTDALLRLQVPAFDFGRALYRIRAANERLEASEALIDDSAVRLAQASIASWYQVFTYRAMVRLSEAFVANQDELRAALERRIQEGASAPADLAQFDSYRAAALSQLADFRRQLSVAEAQYEAYVGMPPPDDLTRAPSAEAVGITREVAVASVDMLPIVQRAALVASAADFETKAVRAQEMPQLSVGLDAGRYGVFENEHDYDIRASVTLSQRLFGGAQERTAQAAARERGAQAAYERIRTEAERDAQIAWADVQALQASTEALRENYIASRQARDALFERFLYARGTLFDVLSAQTNYFNVAVRYLAAVSELDIARYNLLARTGRLLDSLEIDQAMVDG